MGTAAQQNAARTALAMESITGSYVVVSCTPAPWFLDTERKVGRTLECETLKQKWTIISSLDI